MMDFQFDNVLDEFLAKLNGDDQSINTRGTRASEEKPIVDGTQAMSEVR